MTTQCNVEGFEFQRRGRRRVVVAFDGGPISSDGGALLLGEVERRRRLIARFAACFEDHRAEPWSSTRSWSPVSTKSGQLQSASKCWQGLRDKASVTRRRGRPS